MLRMLSVADTMAALIHFTSCFVGVAFDVATELGLSTLNLVSASGTVSWSDRFPLRNHLE